MVEEDKMEELDLTPYEEDDDNLLHRKLVAAKMARKRAEEDLKLLCNRIGLLKQEESKVIQNSKVLGCAEDRRNKKESQWYYIPKKT